MAYFVYMVQCKDGSLYTGITTDVERRVTEHNSVDKGARYTRARQPVTVVYSEAVKDRSTATKREYDIKQLSRSEKEQLCRLGT